MKIFAIIIAIIFLIFTLFATISCLIVAKKADENIGQRTFPINANQKGKCEQEKEEQYDQEISKL